jgi:hypothetical protein
VPFGPQLLCNEWSKATFPLPNCLIGERQSSLEKHLGEISQAQLVPEPPQNNQEDHIGGIFQEVAWRSCALVEEALASEASEHAIAERGLLDLFFTGG